MFQIGDIVVMPADQIDDEVYGIITGLDGEMYGLKFYKILWFDGQDSSETQNDIIKVDTDVPNR
jgi:hypothetical protein